MADYNDLDKSTLLDSFSNSVRKYLDQNEKKLQFPEAITKLPRKE